jgi:4-hydroxybutyrate CoA-transferase
MITAAMADLMKSGAVNGSKKNLHKGKAVGAFAFGTAELYEYMDGNPSIELLPTAYVNDPFIIAQNDNLISVNNALMMDLTGQAASESLRHKQYSGTGGQVNFALGALMSRGGKSIMALSSTFKDKEGRLRSRIVPFLPQGTIVSTSRNDIQYVITEYGVVHLKYNSIPERVKKMISIAHPDFRDELTFQAKRLGWL